jgi:serine/threonine protein kinase
MLLSVGQTINRYQINALLGEGGMGSVYQAHDPRLQRDVAIKVMHPHFARQPSFRERFMQEARTAARLDHPGIVKIFDSGEENEILYIVMEFIHGPNMRQILTNLAKEKRLVLLPEAAQVVRLICLALDYTHRSGVLYRDIKPDNIMLKPEPVEGLPYRPVLTDLGLAKLLEGIPITREGESLGTPAYMSPEQALGVKVDARSDVYSLGILLYELSVGRLPFPAKTLSEAIRYHTKELPPPPAAIRVDLPDSLAKVILKCLEKKPESRYSNAQQLAEAIAAAINSLASPEAASARPGPSNRQPASSLMIPYQAGLADARRGNSMGLPPRQSPDPGADGIVIMTKDRTARSIIIKNKTVTVGRDEDNDIVLDDPKASRRHVQVQFDGTNYQVIDMNSTNGTVLGNSGLLAGVPVTWTQEKLLRIGDTWLRLERAGPPPVKTMPQTDSSEFTPTIGGRARISLEPQFLSVQPGGSAALKIMLVNQSPIVDHFTISLAGVPADWVPAASSEAQLMPAMRHEVSMTIQPPHSPKSRAGSYTLTARVSSCTAPEDYAEVTSTLSVTPFYKAEVSLHPQKLRSVDDGKYTVVISNQGNADLHGSFSGSDPEEGCLYSFEPNPALIPAGEERQVQLTVRPKAPLSEWSTRTYYFIVSPHTEEGPNLIQQIRGELELTAPTFELSLRPQKQRGSSQGSFSIQLNNRSQKTLRINLAAIDPEESCRYQVDPAELVVEPGRECMAHLMVFPKSFVFGDQVKTIPFTVTGRLVDTPGLFRQVPGEWEQAAPLIEINLAPQKQSGTQVGKFALQLCNRSEAELAVDLQAADAGNLCSYTLNPAHLALPVGELRNVDLQVVPKLPLVGQASRQVQFDVHARIAGQTTPITRVQGEWEQWLPPVAQPVPAVLPASDGKIKPIWSPEPVAQPVQPGKSPQLTQQVADSKPKHSFVAGCLLFIVGIFLTLVGVVLTGNSFTPYDYSVRSTVEIVAGSVLVIGLILTVIIAIQAYRKKLNRRLVLFAIFGLIGIILIYYSHYIGQFR